MFGVYGLIFGVLDAATIYVGRSWDFAVFFAQGKDFFVGAMKVEGAGSFGAVFEDDVRDGSVGEFKDVAGAEFFGTGNEHGPFAGCAFAWIQEECLVRSAGAGGEEAGAEHLAIVKNQKIVWTQKRGEIVYVRVFETMR